MQEPSDTEFRALRGLFYVLYLRGQVRADAEKQFPDNQSKQSWHRRAEQQAYYDVLNSFKLARFIEAFDLSAQSVTFKGVEYFLEDLPEHIRCPVQFIQTGEARDV